VAGRPGPPEGLRSRLLPTAFPGFSWDNLAGKAPGSTMIPRRKGEFYWRQFAIFRNLGVRTVFVDTDREIRAIFDRLEGATRAVVDLGVSF
jgi:hypothetical protein